jgi:uncharacterized LabA/DUF88 family protein
MEAKKSPKNILYIDAANLILTARDFQLEYNIYWLLEYLKFRYKIDNCIYFTGRFAGLEKDYESLTSIGVEIVFKETYRETDKIKANCDVEISHRVTFDIENNLVNKVILMSGDGDFYSLLAYAKLAHRKIKLLGIHPKKTSRLYKDGMKFNLTYVSQILSEIDLLKGESLVGPLVPTRLFLSYYSIADVQNLSSQTKTDNI